MVAVVEFKQPETPAEKPAEVENKEANVAAVAAGTRPAWLPDNFKTVEDFVKSTDETKATLTRTQQELAKLKGDKPEDEKKPDEAKPEEKKPEVEETPEQKAAKEAVEKAGIDTAPYQTEFDTTGDVSEDNRAKLAESFKAQFGDKSRELVDAFVEGQKARRQNYSAEVFGQAGGEEAYGEMIAWASTGLSAPEKATFNAGVNSGDVNKAKMAVASLQTLYTKANGKAPNLLGGEKPSPSNQGFASSFEMQAAMSDKRYGKDPVYTKSVEQRTMKSNF